MIHFKHISASLVVALLFFTLYDDSIALSAESPEAPTRFPNPITLYVGYAPGGSFDITARLIGKYIGRYLPSQPTVLVSYKPGSGTRVLAGYLYSAAKRDGSEFGQLNSGILFKQLLSGETEQFVAPQFSYIGSTSSERGTCFIRSVIPVTNLEGAKSRELAMGASDPLGADAVGMRVANRLLGTKFKPIPGYPGGTEQNLAIARGELDGRCTTWNGIKLERPDWIAKNEVRSLLQTSLTPNPDLPGVPLMRDLVTNDRDKAAVSLIASGQEIGFPFVLPPNVPAKIINVFRDAFTRTTRNPEFLAEARAIELEVDPVSGDRAQELVNSAYTAPKNVVDRARNLME
jgi:tripartite-type tricarboxylate transporter receptor subunit TctC